MAISVITKKRAAAKGVTTVNLLVVVRDAIAGEKLYRVMKVPLAAATPGNGIKTLSNLTAGYSTPQV
jgi:hypothetical protein